MTYIDYIILIVIVLFIIKGYKQGLVKQVMAFIGMAAGLVIAWRFYPVVSLYGVKLGIPSTISMILSFIIIFCAVMAASNLLAKFLHKVLEIVFFGWLNRLTGAVFGLVEGVLLVAIIFVLISFTPLRESVLNIEGKAPVVDIMKKIASPFSEKIQELYKSLPISI